MPHAQTPSTSVYGSNQVYDNSAGDKSKEGIDVQVLNNDGIGTDNEVIGDDKADRVQFISQEGGTITTHGGNDDVSVICSQDITVDTGKTLIQLAGEHLGLLTPFTDDDTVNVVLSKGVNIQTSTGNDTINVDSSSRVNIDAGRGDDTIRMANTNESLSIIIVDGGEGSDTFVTRSKIISQTTKDGVTTVKTKDGSVITLTNVEHIRYDATFASNTHDAPKAARGASDPEQGRQA